MSSIESSTVKVSTAAAVFCTILALTGGIGGSYVATRLAIEHELSDIKTTLLVEIVERKKDYAVLDERVTNHGEELARIREALKPDGPTFRRYGKK